MVLLLFQFELKMAVHTASTEKKKSLKRAAFDKFLRKVYFIFKLASERDTDFSKLVNL